MARNTQHKSRVSRSGFGPSSTGVGDSGSSGDDLYGKGAGSLKDVRSRRDLSGAYGSGAHGSEREKIGSDQVSSRYGKNAFGGALSAKQIILFWSVTLVMMLVVFVSGYQAGKDEGAREVLDQAGQHMVRLPIARPAASFLNNEANTSGKIVDESGLGAVATSDSKVQAPAIKTPGVLGGKVPAGASLPVDQKIDFTKTESLPLKETVKSDSSLTSIKVKEAGKPKQAYEEVYPGKKLFPPPGGKNPEKEASIDSVQGLPFKVDPPSEKPVEKIIAEPVKEVTLAPVSGWYLQVSASPTKEDALAVVGRLKAKNLPVRIEEAPIKNQKYYRILVGPYPDRGEAMKLRGEAKSASGVSAEPFIRQVK